MNTNQNTSKCLLQDLETCVDQALKEDLGSGDITAQLIPADKNTHASIFFREKGIVCGRPWVERVFTKIDPDLQLRWLIEEGALAEPNQKILAISGNARSILTAERCALNFLQTLSGTATTTFHWAQQIAQTDAILLDTRKTIPGLRRAQKYAVTIGGGQNHRQGLYDAFLIKENHILASGSIEKAVTVARTLYPDKCVEVEVETLSELDLALNACPDIIMLDNFTLPQLQTGVRRAAGQVKLEASGNITLSNLLQIAQTGIDYISVGALTKHVKAVDLSLRFDQPF